MGVEKQAEPKLMVSRWEEALRDGGVKTDGRLNWGRGGLKWTAKSTALTFRVRGTGRAAAGGTEKWRDLGSLRSLSLFIISPSGEGCLADRSLKWGA